MRRWRIGLGAMCGLWLVACGGGQNQQNQTPTTRQGVVDNTGLPTGGRAAPNAPAEAPLPTVRDLVVRDATAYVVTADGLVIVDLGRPAEPKVLTTVAVGNQAQRVALAGDKAVVAAGAGGLKVVGLTKLAEATVLGTYAPSAGDVNLVAADGATALVGLGAAGLALVNLADPSAPAEIKRLPEHKGARALALRGTWGYVLGDRLTVLDLGKPAEPKVAATVDLKDAGRALCLDGEHALVGGDKYCQWLDLRQPAKPAKLSAVAWGDLLKAWPAPPAPAAPAGGTPTTTPAAVLVSSGQGVAWLARADRVWRADIEDGKTLKASGDVRTTPAPVRVAAGGAQPVAATADGTLLVLGASDKGLTVVGQTPLAARPAPPVRPST